MGAEFVTYQPGKETLSWQRYSIAHRSKEIASTLVWQSDNSVTGELEVAESNLIQLGVEETPQDALESTAEVPIPLS